MPEETTPVIEPTTPVKPPAQPTEDAPTLTQKQADAIIGSRVKEASAASLSALAKELGYETVDDMKAAAKDAKKRKDDELSELDKATKRAEKAEAEKAEALAVIETEKAARIADKVNGKIEALAAKAKAHPPYDDVVLFLRTNHGEALSTAVSPDGVVNEKAIEKLITDTKTARPHWFSATGPGSPSNNNGTAPAPDPKQWGDKPLARL